MIFFYGFYSRRIFDREDNALRKSLVFDYIVNEK